MGKAERKALLANYVNDWINSSAADEGDIAMLRAQLEETGLLVYVDNSAAALDALSNGAIFVRVGADSDDESRDSAVRQYLIDIGAATLDERPDDYSGTADDFADDIPF